MIMPIVAAFLEWFGSRALEQCRQFMTKIQPCEHIENFIHIRFKFTIEQIF